MSGTLRRTESLTSGLSLVFKPLQLDTITSSPPEVPSNPEPPVQKQPSYSFLAIVLQGFAEEPVPLWEEPTLSCPLMDKLLGEKKKARPSIHRRSSLSSIEEQHGVTRAERSFSRSSYQMERIPSDLDPVNELVELADFHADNSELSNPSTELSPVTTLYHRYLGVSPTQHSLQRILSSSPRRLPLPSFAFATAPISSSTTTATVEARQISNRQGLTIEINKPSDVVSISSSPPPSLSSSVLPSPARSPLYISIPLTLPSLVPLPRSPHLIPASTLPTFEISSTPPSLSSSPTLSFSNPPSPTTPSTPLTYDFATLPRKGETTIRRNRFDRAVGEAVKLV
ncbi:hypothetical protein JCM5353_008426 [Sporobolomyces roseus]